MTTTTSPELKDMLKENSEEHTNVLKFQRPATSGGFTQTNWLAHLEPGTIFSARYEKDPRYLVHRFILLRHDIRTSTLLTVRPGDSMFDVHTFDFSLDWEKVEVYGKCSWLSDFLGTEENEGSD